MRKKFYYYTIIIVSMLVTTTKLYAQISPRNVEELMSYFANNTQNLDPIEGVYDVNIEQWGENAFRKFPSETTNITMVIYKDRTGIFRVFKNEQVTIKKIGSTPIYNYNIFWSGSNITDSKRFVLHENTLFDVNYSIPDRQLRYDLGKNYQAGFKVNYKCSFIKTYPTPEMYANSQKQDKSQESFNQWSGTGFALKDGYIVTNYHVIEGANSITIQGVNGNFNIQYNTSIVGTDKINDLALLKVTDPTFKGFGIIPYSISSAISEVGEEIFVLGYPLTSTMGDEIKLTTGVISSKTGFQGDIALYRLLANLYVIPLESSFMVKVQAFFRFIFFEKLPLTVAKNVFQKENYTEMERRVLHLARKARLSCAEILACIANDEIDTSIGNQSELQKEKARDNLGFFLWFCDGHRKALEAISTLYLNKDIIFDKRK